MKPQQELPLGVRCQDLTFEHIFMFYSRMKEVINDNTDAYFSI